jgi:ankyrin repeat protein
MRVFLFAIPFCVAATIAAPAQDLPAQDLNDRLYDAIRNDNTAEIQKLIKNSGPDTRDRRGTTPLMYAAAAGSFETIKMLVEAGAEVNAKNDFDITALMWCATDEPKVRLLLGKGADPNARSKQGRTPLLIASGTEGTSGIVKLLLDKGASLKSADANPVTTPLTAAAAANDSQTVRLLLEHGAESGGPGGAFALMAAAGHGNTGMIGMLLARGAPVNAVSPPVNETVKNGNLALGSFTPLILAAAYGGPDAAKLLLDHKADVNARDVRGMTPLMLALALDHPDPRVVRLLLERGADPNIKSKDGETAIDWAGKFNHPEIMKALNVPPASSGTAAPRAVSVENPLRPAEAVRKSAGLLQGITAKFFVEGGCPSCHSHNLTAMAIEAVRSAGLKVDEPAAAAMARQTRAFWSPQEQQLMLRMDAPGGHNMTANGVLEFVSEHAPPSMMIDAMVHNIAAQQQRDGSWHSDGIARPPMLDGDCTNTAIAIRSLSVYGPPARKTEIASRIAKGAHWLRGATPVTAEDYNMQLLGLKWAGADAGSLHPIAHTIATLQRADGGWSQTPYLASDAYATGQTLEALRQAGLGTDEPVYRKGVEFLLRTQMPDGSWHVISRAPGFQPYFQSGFPYDHDQWISMAGTAWATTALAYAAPESKTVASK